MLHPALLSLPRSMRYRLAFKYTPGDSLVNAGATFSRGSTATYKDINGTRQTALSGVARDGHYISGVQSLLLEGQRTNHFLQSGTPATQTSASLTTGTYTLWIEGTGSIAVAGTTATITGAGSAVAGTPKTFVVTVAGTVTYTVTGSPTLAQSEDGAFASSYIPTTTVAVTRSADSLYFPWLYVPQITTLYFKLVQLGDGTASPGLAMIDNAGNSGNRFGSYIDTANKPHGFLTNGGSSADVTATNALVINSVGEVRIVQQSDGSVIVGNSVASGAESPVTSSAIGIPASYTDSKLWINSTGSSAVGFGAYQSIKSVLRVASLAEMRAA